MEITPYRPEAPDQTPSRHPPYASTEITGPGAVWDRLMGPEMFDLTRQHTSEPIGQRIIVSGRVLDEDGRPVPQTVVEVWQANAAGRYIHARDQWDAPLDPNFTGVGRVVTDEAGRYRFITVKPGAYPWGNHKNAWRPEHIHFSLFGPAFATRLVTQMYFPGDPLILIDPIAAAAPGNARERMINRFDIETTQEAFALSYIFDIVLRGRGATPFEGQP